MHGVKRTKVSPEAAEAKRLKELTKIQAYTALEEDVLARKKANDYSPEALKQTTALLDLNPEFYTIWNYRRNILSRGLIPKSTPEEVVALLTADLRLTMAYMKVHPKVYWIWTHRKWCLENVPQGPDDTEGWREEFWRTELAVVEKILSVDARNFHAWSYRRYVVGSLPASFTPPRTPADELKYTTKKIEANFSNFSAWHHRTKLLGKEWAALPADKVAAQKDKEFELVTQALWTDPGDQSGWLYHRWLVGTAPTVLVLTREVDNIRELNEAEPDSKWCMNALAHNLLLLAGLSSEAEAKALRTEAKSLLERLEVIDEDRKERYRELAGKQ
ncbi:Geranylgeranyl transferase type-2 subunit alpha [Vanrija pseudolonga]|uniref:Geranylgeranyl transferase type-2 subunit alpha n=1 Tax=Vanrija pseudolonga TaxID=143232 RepID=A0AAF0Y359_9TREE|nr:Geranylgeranyl transferase type-2 subunit alpha [Vanrija pseudolonga]